MAAPIGKLCFALGSRTLPIDTRYLNCKLSTISGITTGFTGKVYKPDGMIGRTFVKSQRPLNGNCCSNGRYLRTLGLNWTTPLSESTHVFGPNTKCRISYNKNMSSSSRHYGHLRKPPTTQHGQNAKSPLTYERELWNLRLANENGYLSSCRNAYISVIAGATVYAQHGLVTYGQEAGVLLIWLGGVNLLWGTGLFLYHSIKLRRLILMSRLSLVVHCAMAVAHLIIWVGAMAIYLEYVEEEEKKNEI